MKNLINMTSKTVTIFASSLLILGLVACGNSSGDKKSTEPTGVVSGTIQDVGSSALPAAQSQALNGATITLDDGNVATVVDGQGYFTVFNVPDGDHSLYLHLANGGTLEMPIRILNQRNINLGEISFDKNFMISHTGFDGYRFGFIDENGDGINDNFTDADGDGICDKDRLYAGSPYLMGLGFVDANKDGINDNFIDANGDGICDLTGNHSGAGFGFVDEDGDGINDNFVDADGDGICDHNQTPYSHPFGYIDADGDGINDNFTDADGDGICDNNRFYAGVPYVAMPGWTDVDNDGINDGFQDQDGNGINDVNGIPYSHGFGWEDANGDQLNDRIRDRDGDCICDGEDCLYYLYRYNYGYSAPHRDQNGDSIDDDTGQPFRHGFGWGDNDNDGVNDIFGDADGDGYNDRNGMGYVGGNGHGGS